MAGKPRPDGRREAGGGNRLADLRQLIREQRRITLRARTIAITLESALREYNVGEASAGQSVEQRIAVRRAWCERVLEIVQEVRAHALRNQQAFDLISAKGGLGRSGPARFAAAERETERQARRAEEAALAAIG